MGLTKTYFGKKIIFNTKNIHTLSLIDTGKLEGAVCDLFEKHIKPKNVVIDAGANIGFLSLLAGHLVGPQGHVISIEANPDVFKTLEENILINGFRPRYTTHEMAAFDKPAELEFTWNSHREGSGRIVTKVQSNIAEKKCKVKANTLDNVCNHPKVDFIKVDTEGAEPYVLKGAINIIKNNPNIKVIFEWNGEHIRLREADPQEFVDFVFTHFKHVKRIVKVGQLEPLTKQSLMELSHSNIFAHN